MNFLLRFEKCVPKIFWQIHRRSLHSRSSQTRMGHTTNFLYFVFFGSKFLSKRLIKVEVDFISFTITFRNSKSKVFCSFRISISFTRQHRQFDSQVNKSSIELLLPASFIWTSSSINYLRKIPLSFCCFFPNQIHSADDEYFAFCFHQIPNYSNYK